ncbi:MAG: hemolysin III family protein [Xanthomonadales bacterium]|nr:hemolysin III family protein [Xanthomonadales bacterium]
MNTKKNHHSLYELREEIANAVTHGIGAVLGITALVLLVIMALTQQDSMRLAAAITYGSSLILLYVASTLYHSVPGQRAKRFFQKLDHAAIYVLIAGTYTPVLLISMKGAWGYTLMGIVWSIAVFGVCFKFFFHDRFEKLSLFSYIAMGWIVVFAASELIIKVPTAGLLFLLAGGLAYTLGTIFYANDRIPYNHAIWHLFVLAGSVLHFVAIYNYVMPSAASLT